MLEIENTEETLDYEKLDYNLKLWFTLCCFLRHSDNEAEKLPKIYSLFTAIDENIRRLDFTELVTFLSPFISNDYFSGQNEKFFATSNFLDYVILTVPEEDRKLLFSKLIKNFYCTKGCFSPK